MVILIDDVQYQALKEIINLIKNSVDKKTYIETIVNLNGDNKKLN